MVAFIDAHREEYGVEPICAQLPMAPSTYYEHKARQADPSRAPERVRRDRELEVQIQRVWDENFQVYGVRKTWRALKREDIAVARCTVARLMAQLGLRGAVRGRAFKTTTVSDATLARPEDRVQRNFAAERPGALWVSDLTYVATWRGFVYVAFVIDAFARRIVGWRVSKYPSDRSGPRCARAGALRTRSRRRATAGSPQRQGFAVSVDSLYRTAQGCRAGALGGQRGWTPTTTPWPNRSSVCTRPR